MLVKINNNQVKLSSYFILLLLVMSIIMISYVHKYYISAGSLKKLFKMLWPLLADIYLNQRKKKGWDIPTWSKISHLAGFLEKTLMSEFQLWWISSLTNNTLLIISLDLNVITRGIHDESNIAQIIFVFNQVWKSIWQWRDQTLHLPV